MERLPGDLMRVVLRLLPRSSLEKLAQVSKRYAAAVQSELRKQQADFMLRHDPCSRAGDLLGLPEFIYLTFFSCGAYSAGEARHSIHDHHDFVALQTDLDVLHSLAGSLDKMARDGKWPEYYIPHAMRLPLCPPFPQNEQDFRQSLRWQLTRVERPLDLGLYEAVPLAAVKDEDNRLFSSLRTIAEGFPLLYGLLHATAVFLNTQNWGTDSSHTLVFGLHPETGSALGFGVYTGT
jgi:hypothetical protein